MEKGAYTLLITPFKDDYSLDEKGLEILVERQVESGIHGIAPLGVTGENTLMTDEEVLKTLQIVVKTARARCKVIPDTCVMSLWKAKERVKQYADLGADYIAMFTPYFVLPQPEGLIDYYQQVADASPVPIILHSAKERTGVELTPDMILTLAKHPNIAGIKDGKKELDHLAKVIYLTRNEDFLVFTAKDTTAFPLASFGGAGTFTVSGNIIPGIMKDMMQAIFSGDPQKALEMHYNHYPLFEAMRYETNPMGAKMALNLMGLPGGPLRSPLSSLSGKKTEALKKILAERKLI
jgi:4-hydroxy-tetrahydrodipicolinate synthase